MSPGSFDVPAALTSSPYKLMDGTTGWVVNRLTSLPSYSDTMTETIEIEVGTVADFIGQIAYLHAELSVPLWYRGQRDARWSVQAAIWRDDPVRGSYTPADERNFTHRFRTRAAMRYPNEHLSYNDHPAWLSLMQHYGLPTRLLDWSRSPLVAAYFAVEAYFDGQVVPQDAAIYVLSPHEMNRHHVQIDVTPAINSAVCDDWVKPAFLNEYDRQRHHEDLRGPIAVMASELDLRMFVQQGCFTVHKPITDPLDFGESPGMRFRFLIPRLQVREFAMQMHALGFRGGDLFPDLQNLASELVRSHPAGSVGPMKF